MWDDVSSTLYFQVGIGTGNAKIVGDHGGIIECESLPRHTIFRVLMPMFTDAEPGGAT